MTFFNVQMEANCARLDAETKFRCPKPKGDMHFRE